MIAANGTSTIINANGIKSFSMSRFLLKDASPSNLKAKR